MIPQEGLEDVAVKKDIKATMVILLLPRRRLGCLAQDAKKHLRYMRCWHFKVL